MEKHLYLPEEEGGDHMLDTLMVRETDLESPRVTPPQYSAYLLQANILKESHDHHMTQQEKGRGGLRLPLGWSRGTSGCPSQLELKFGPPRLHIDIHLPLGYQGG